MAMNPDFRGPFSKYHFPCQGLTGRYAHRAQLSGEAWQASPQLCQGQWARGNQAQPALPGCHPVLPRPPGRERPGSQVGSAMSARQGAPRALLGAGQGLQGSRLGPLQPDPPGKVSPAPGSAPQDSAGGWDEAAAAQSLSRAPLL